MKFFAMFVVMIALLAALCSAQPVDSLTPGQPDSSVNVRVKTGIIYRPICPPGYVLVRHECVREPEEDYYLGDDYGWFRHDRRMKAGFRKREAENY